MWSLLQFISGSIQRNPVWFCDCFYVTFKNNVFELPIIFQVSNFMSVLSLFDMLYPEKEPLPVPDCTKTYATRQVRNL